MVPYSWKGNCRCFCTGHSSQTAVVYSAISSQPKTRKRAPHSTLLMLSFYSINRRVCTCRRHMATQSGTTSYHASIDFADVTIAVPGFDVLTVITILVVWLCCFCRFCSRCEYPGTAAPVYWYWKLDRDSPIQLFIAWCAWLL